VEASIYAIRVGLECAHGHLFWTQTVIVGGFTC
jgi:hypothetical protein